MGSTTHAIEVNAPLSAVYNQWTQFEEFPSFMEGVEEVRQDGPSRLLWKVTIGGRDKEWEAEITEQVPDAKIAWQSIDGAPNSGEVNFESLDSERTRITLTIDYEPEGILEKAGDVLGIPSGRVEADLKRFRDFIENKGQSNGWRGTIGTGEIPASSLNNENQAEFADEESGFLDKSSLNDEKEIAPIDKDWPAQMPAEQAAPLSSRESSVENDWPAQTPIEEPAPLSSRESTIEKNWPAQTPAEQSAPVGVREFPIELPDKPSPSEPELAKTELPPVEVPRVTREEIASRAYELYLERGQIPGYEEEDWLEAERQLTTRSGR
jgi:Polyketide cyclase / dehydrase and lipid transport/Protein of unknown function (DUF2934)